MSNPVKNAEVEDVLSSVRRLVSNDPRPANRASDEMRSGEDATQSEVDRLVLTPALRVAVVQDLPDASEDEASDPSEGKTEPAEQEPESTEDAFSAQPDLGGQGAVEEVGPEAAVLSNDAVDIEASRFFARGEEEPSWKGPSTQIDPEELRFLFRARKKSVHVTEAIDDEASEAETPGTQENPETVSVDADTGEDSKPAPFLLTDPEPSVAEHDEQNEFEAIAEQDGVQSSDDSDKSVSLHELTAKIAAVEAIIAKTSEQWTADDDGEEEYADTSASDLTWEDQIELDVSEAPLTDGSSETASEEMPEIAEETETQASTPGTWVIPPDALVKQYEEKEGEDQADPNSEVKPDVTAAEPTIVDQQDETFDDSQAYDPDKSVEEEESMFAEETLLDEAALREMIADIVNQELSGSLGERITHNVRKLVRRELQRALSAEELQ